jgi:hypothetical protein
MPGRRQRTNCQQLQVCAPSAACGVACWRPDQTRRMQPPHHGGQPSHTVRFPMCGAPRLRTARGSCMRCPKRSSTGVSSGLRRGHYVPATLPLVKSNIGQELSAEHGRGPHQPLARARRPSTFCRAGGLVSTWTCSAGAASTSPTRNRSLVPNWSPVPQRVGRVRASRAPALLFSGAVTTTVVGPGTGMEAPCGGVKGTEDPVPLAGVGCGAEDARALLQAACRGTLYTPGQV